MAIKSYKPTTNGRRNMTVLVYKDEITCDTPEKSLLQPVKGRGGRNNLGRITVRHKGGCEKRKYRVIDFLRNKDDIPATVRTIEYDPNRSANIALVVYADENENLFLASRNNNKVAVVAFNEINVLDLVAASYLLIDESSVKKIEEVLN